MYSFLYWHLNTLFQSNYFMILTEQKLLYMWWKTIVYLQTDTNTTHWSHLCFLWCFINMLSWFSSISFVFVSLLKGNHAIFTCSIIIALSKFSDDHKDSLLPKAFQCLPNFHTFLFAFWSLPQNWSFLPISYILWNVFAAQKTQEH